MRSGVSSRDKSRLALLNNSGPPESLVVVSRDALKAFESAVKVLERSVAVRLALPSSPKEAVQVEPVSLADRFYAAEMPSVDRKPLLESLDHADEPSNSSSPTSRSSHAAERRLVRKIDRHMAILVLIFLFCHIDRNGYATARLGGLERESVELCPAGLTPQSALFTSPVRDRHGRLHRGVHALAGARQPLLRQHPARPAGSLHGRHRSRMGLRLLLDGSGADLCVPHLLRR